MIGVDTYVEMYLAPAATAVYDWTSVSGVLAESDVVIRRGSENLNDDSPPGWCTFAIDDEAGDFIEDNPIGTYYGSIGRGVVTRVGVTLIDDQFGRTVADTNWGSVGNEDGDVWTAGTSTGGSVLAADWSVSSGTARHSLPTDGAYRLSELSSTTRLFDDVEVHTQVTVPTSNVTGTGALATEVWFRVVDINNFLSVSLVFQTDETLRVALYDRTAGVNRYLLSYTTIPDLSLSTTGVDYQLRCQVEGQTLRAKVWETGEPEPLDWQLSASGATDREGYLAISDYAFSGNTNTKPLVWQHNFFTVRLMGHTGEINSLVTTGEGQGRGTPRITRVRTADLLDRINTPGAKESKSAMFRGRTNDNRWLGLSNRRADSGTTSTAISTTAIFVDIAVGDFFYLTTSLNVRKEDTRFVITAVAVVGADTHLTFTPDARDAVALNDKLLVYRGRGPDTKPVGYWPMEDGTSATQISSGLVGGTPMSIVGSPRFAADSGFLASAPLLQLNDAEFNVNLPDYIDTTNKLSVNFCLGMPATDEAASNTDLIQFSTSGTGYSYDILYTTVGDGAIKILVYNATGTLLYDTGDLGLELRGDRCMITFYLIESGGAVSYGLFRTSSDATSGGFGPITVSGVTSLGKMLTMRVNPGGGYSSVTVGHLTVVPDLWDVATTRDDFVAWTNQSTMRRLDRVAFEQGIPFSYRGDWDILSSALGPQKVAKVIDHFRDGPKSDGGFLYGPKGAVGIEYCSRGALSGREPRATVDGTQVQQPFNPIRDYTTVRNSVTVDRIDGGSATAQLDTGSLSIEDPPSGIGFRDRRFPMSLGDDTQATDHANYRLGVNTVNEHRLPELTLIAGGSSSVDVAKLMSLDIGTRIDITGMSDTKKIFDDMPQLILGYTLKLGNRFAPEISLNTTPYAPWQTLALTTGDDRARIGAADTTTGSTLTTTATGSLTLTSDSGRYLWSTDATDYPQDIVISGERITISGVTSETSPQTATITARSVNGVVKAHSTGETVQVARLNKWAFR